jgi:hypothetical protein
MGPSLSLWERAYARRMANDFNVINFLDADLSSPPQTARILLLT